MPEPREDVIVADLLAEAGDFSLPEYKKRMRPSRSEHSQEWNAVQRRLGKRLFPGRILPLDDAPAAKRKSTAR
jgi:hypothetical protein